MNPDQPMRRPDAGRGTAARLAGALLVGVLVAACAGENLFTFPVKGVSLLGPDVDIIAPLPPVSIEPGDSVDVRATLVSSQGIVEVSWTGTLDAGGAAPFNPIVVALAGVTDTTMSRYMRRLDGTAAGGAKIIVTAKDLDGDTGADTIAVTLN